jgi:DNA polymerase-3 subunit alpha (Gram-positive type)
MEVVNEMYARGINFLPVDLYHSEASQFKYFDKNIRLPFNSLQGLGINAAKNIVQARKNGKFMSVDDLRNRSKISKTVIELLRETGALKGLAESNQISMFE